MPTFSEALQIALETLQGKFTIQEPPVIHLVRDATGAITAVLPDQTLPSAEVSVLARQLHDALGAYSPGLSSVLLEEGDLIDPEDVLHSPDRIRLEDAGRFFLVDRLLTNQDWLRAPLRSQPPLPTLTAYSIKGGVGRSTALAVLAWHLARAGKRVVVVDLDLEAPGIGSMLVTDQPKFGLVDWLTEALANQATQGLLDEVCIRSPLSADTDGVIDVIPAFGTATEEYIAKLGRVYMPAPDPSGSLRGFAGRLSQLMAAVSVRAEPPEAILLDARAGLHDIGAAAVTQLASQVLLFARDDQQTWDAYRRLFEHLRRSPLIAWGMPDTDLRWRLKMVAAQVDPTHPAYERFVDAAYRTWGELYDEESGPSETESGLSAQLFERNDENAPHFPLRVLYDPRVRTLSLLDPEQKPDWEVVEATFGRFLTGATSHLFDGDE